MIYCYKSVPVSPPLTYLDHLVTHGTEWIDLGYSGQNHRIELTCSLLDSRDTALIGSRTSTSSSDAFLILHADNTNALRFDYAAQKLESSVLPTGKFTAFLGSWDYKIEQNEEILAESEFSPTPGANPSNFNIYLFAMNTNGTAEKPTNMEFYGLKVYEESPSLVVGMEPTYELIHNYYPAKDKSGIVCIYDRITRQFLYNSGTGNFEGVEKDG